MAAILRRPALRLAAEYRLKTGTQGHGATKYTTLFRTNLSFVPPDWNHLVEKVLLVSPSASEMKNIQQNTGRAKYSSIPFKGKDNGVCLVQS